MISEHPALLEWESPSIRPVDGGEMPASGAFTPVHTLWLHRLDRPIQPRRPDTGDEADQQDMRLLVAGQGEALQRLMERYADSLSSQLARILKNRTEAQETAQEAFVRVYFHCGRFDFRHKFSTWLYAIAFNLARDRLRRRSRRPGFVSLDDPAEYEALEETLLDPDQPPDTRLDNQERYGVLAEAVKALPEGLQQPLIQFAFEDKSQPEIASEMHCTTKAIEMRLYHARKELHHLLEKEFKKD